MLFHRLGEEEIVVGFYSKLLNAVILWIMVLVHRVTTIEDGDDDEACYLVAFYIVFLIK